MSTFHIEFDFEEVSPEVKNLLVGAPASMSAEELQQFFLDKEFEHTLHAMKMSAEDPEKRGVLVLVHAYSTEYYLTPDIPQNEAVCQLAYAP